MDRIEKLKELLLADPHDSFILHALALEYIKAGDEAAARILLEQVLERDPAAVGSYYQLGRLLNVPVMRGWPCNGMKKAWLPPVRQGRNGLLMNCGRRMTTWPMPDDRVIII